MNFLRSYITAFAVLPALLGGVSALPGHVFAQASSAGTTISPPLIDLVANAGEVLTKSIEVSNNGSVPIIYNLSVSSMAAGEDDGSSVFSASSAGNLSGWIKLTPATIKIAPNSKETINVSIVVPAGTRPGGHYATIFAATESSSSDQAGASIRQMVGVNVLLKVAGALNESASVTEFSTPQPRLVPGAPVDFVVRVKNTGSVHLKPAGVIEIYNGSVKVEELAINPDGGNVLPDSSRKFSARSNKSLPAGTYSAKLVLRYGSSGSIMVPAISFMVVGESSTAWMVAGLVGVFALILLVMLMVNRQKPQPVVPTRNGRS